MSLFLKECKQVGKSVLYLAFVAITIIFYISQLGEFTADDIRAANSATAPYNASNPLMLPPPDATNYGSKPVEDPKQVMPNAVQKLLYQYQENSYTTYPIGFYKTVRLNDAQQAEIAGIFKELTGLSADALDAMITQHILDYQSSLPEGSPIYENKIPPLEIPFQVDYETFKEKMGRIDHILGGGSDAAVDSLSQYGSEPVTYEEKLAEYNTLLEKDKVTGAYARLFCDYMGIVVALFAVFVPVSYWLKDRRAQMLELIYVRSIGSTRLLLTRFFANVAMLLLPFLLLSLLPTFQLVSFGLKAGLAVNPFAFLQYILWWLLPSILLTTAVGTFLTILTSTPLGIAVQFFWSFFTIFSTPVLAGGPYGLQIAIRHNSLQKLSLLEANLSSLWFNRIFFTVLALVLVFACIFLLEMKRSGKLHVQLRKRSAPVPG